LAQRAYFSCRICYRKLPYIREEFVDYRYISPTHLQKLTYRTASNRHHDAAWQISNSQNFYPPQTQPQTMSQTATASNRISLLHTPGLIALFVILVLAGAFISRDALAQASDDPVTVLIHHWNFNEIPNDFDFSTTEPELLNASSRQYGAFLSYDGARWDRVNDPTPLNAREVPYIEEDDRALRLRNPAGALTLHLPTKGFSNVVLRYATTRTASGAHKQQVSYSIDGENFTTNGLDSTEFYVSLYYGLVELDFSGMEGVDDNPDFKVRLTLAGENSEPENTSGNQRINHVTMEGLELEPDVRRSLIHHWNFDNIPNDVDFPTALEISAGGILGGQSTVGGAWLRYDGARWDRVNDPTPFNARTQPYDIEDDRALRMRNPAGDFIVRIPTTGHKNVVVRYAAKRTDSGSELQHIAWSTDGTVFHTDGLAYNSVHVGLNYVLYEFDFTGWEDVDDNPVFTLRIRAAGSGSEPDNESGNQRFNHLTVDATSTETSADDGFGDLPQRIALEQNYPNPFNPATRISYTVPEQMHVSIEVYDITGRHIETLVNQTVPAGNHTVTFDGTRLSSGIYMYRMQVGNQSFTRRMMLVK
jgi:hypothetical protein